jgi:hypothetical protein
MNSLQDLDCNCNDCIFMVRDSERRKQSLQFHEGLQRAAFKKDQSKFQFDPKPVTIHYGNCTKFDKPVSFIPNVCQLETQTCFKNRRQ